MLEEFKLIVAGGRDFNDKRRFPLQARCFRFWDFIGAFRKAMNNWSYNYFFKE